MCRKFFVSGCRKNSQGNPSLFQTILASIVFMQRRGAYSFVKKLFCFTGPKNFVSVKSVFQKFSGEDNKLLIKDGSCPVFASICLTHSAGNFCGILFNVSRNFGYWKFSCIRNGYHYLPLNYFKVSESRKSFLGYLFNVSDIFGYRQSLCIRKGYHLFVLKFFSSHIAGKFPGGTIHCVRKIRVSKNFSAQEGVTTSFCWIVL